MHYARISTWYKFAAPRYIGCRADCSGERRTSPFNGIERSLSRAGVINTKSLPVSTTTFQTALSLYIAHDGRKHKHNPTLSANKHVVAEWSERLTSRLVGWLGAAAVGSIPALVTFFSFSSLLLLFLPSLSKAASNGISLTEDHDVVLFTRKSLPENRNRGWDQRRKGTR